MSTSFYVLMGILGCLTAFNLFAARGQKESKARQFGIWLNCAALALIILAIVISLVAG